MDKKELDLEEKITHLVLNAVADDYHPNTVSRIKELCKEYHELTGRYYRFPVAEGYQER